MPAGQHPVPAPFDGRVIVEAERRHAERLRLPKQASLVEAHQIVELLAALAIQGVVSVALQQPAELSLLARRHLRVGKRQDFLVR